MDQPPPVFFGDSLIEIEKFLLDELDRQTTETPERPFLFGVRQGAVIAIAAGLVSPDTLSGVIAIEGMLPTVTGWSPPLVPLDGLPVLLAGVPLVTQRPTVCSGSALAERLTSWGAVVSSCAFHSATSETSEIANWLRAQPPRFGGPPAGDL